MAALNSLLRCMVYKEGNIFIAACIDIALACQDETRDGAVNKLASQLDDYVKEAMSEPFYAQDVMKNRKAPFSWFVKYYKIKLMSQFFHNKSYETVDVPVGSCC